MMKNFINKILDVPKLIRRIWLILWILLAILLVMKFCFGIWYPIVVKNEVIIRFNDFISNSWAKYISLGILYLLSGNLLYLISCLKFKYSKIFECIIVNIILLCIFIIKCFNDSFTVILELIIFVVIPIIVIFKTYKKANKILSVLYPIIIQFLVFLWQLNIFLIRDVDFTKINNEYILFGFVLQLDYYIFLILTWIGVTKMGLFSAWLFSKDITVLKAEREKELKKAKPNMKKVNSLDIRIAELEKEGK